MNQNVIRYFNSSSISEFESAEFTNIPLTQFRDNSINIIEELNKPDSLVNSEYNLRLKLYETKEAFHENIVEDTPDEEVDNLKDVILKGQKLLKNEIYKYCNLKDSLEQLQERNDAFHSQVLAMKRCLMFLQEMVVDDGGIEKSDIDLIYQEIDSLDSKFNNNLNEKLGILNADYVKSSTKLMKLKNVYQVLKDSDITYTCPICLNMQVECFLIPCGHCFCQNCTSSLSTKCFLCRREFSKKCNLYLN